jgi:hypothetical protein
LNFLGAAAFSLLAFFVLLPFVPAAALAPLFFLGLGVLAVSVSSVSSSLSEVSSFLALRGLAAFFAAGFAFAAAAAGFFCLGLGLDLTNASSSSSSLQCHNRMDCNI